MIDIMNKYAKIMASRDGIVIAAKKAYRFTQQSC